MLSRSPGDRPTANEILHRYVPSQKEKELKWSRVNRKILRQQLFELEELYGKIQKRRKSF